MKKLLALALVLVLALSLAACGGGSGGSSAPAPDGGSSTPPADSDAPAPSGEQRTVKVLQFKTEIHDDLQAMAQDYMTENPDIKLEIESVQAGDYQTILKTRFASGDAPDIFNNEGYNQMDLWLEYMEDLSDQPWVSRMIPLSQEGITKDGKVYGLPLYVEGYNWAYNKQIFADAGITELPTTLSGTKELFETLKAAGHGVTSTQMGDFYAMGVFALNIAMARQDDVNAFIEGLNNGTETFTGNAIFEEWIDVIDLMVEYSVQDPLQIDFSTSTALFTNEEAAIVLANLAEKTMWDEMNPEMEVGTFPVAINDDAAANDVYYVGAATYWNVNKDSAVKDDAKAFLNWLVSSDTGKHYLTDVFKFVPGMVDIEANPEAVGDIGMAMQQYIEEGKVLGWNWPKYPAGATVDLGTLIQEYGAGRLSRDELLAGFDEAWQRLAAEA